MSVLLTIKNIILIIIIILALIWFISNVWSNIRIEQIKSWPVTTATVLNSKAKTETATFSTGTLYRNLKSTITDETSYTRYFPQVTYKYTVDGKKYKSSGIRYDRSKNYDTNGIKNLMIQFSPGNKIPIRYNLENPIESYIFTDTASYSGIVISLIILGTAVGLLYYDGWGRDSDESDIGTITVTPSRERKFW